VKLATAIGVIAIALAAAVYLHQRTHRIPCGVAGIYRQCSVRSSWQDPVAVLIALGGVAVAVAIVPPRRFAKPSN
jgi:hypothetical protein